MVENIDFQFFSGQSEAILTSKMAYFTKKTGNQKYGCYNCKRRIILIDFLVQLCDSDLIIGSTDELWRAICPIVNNLNGFNGHFLPSCVGQL